MGQDVRATDSIRIQKASGQRGPRVSVRMGSPHSMAGASASSPPWRRRAGRRRRGTIVEYTDTKRPRNEYPRRIISPTRPGPCCAENMETLGKVHRDRGKFFYKRCTRCGYTVRCFVRLDWRWIRVQLARVTRPTASLPSDPLLDTCIAYRWVR